MSLMEKHAIFEKNSIVLLLGIVIMIAIGGLVEVVPLFYLKSTIEKVEGMRPYTPLELAGRNIYIREGCYNCHSQMIRPMRDEIERYGHFSLAAESMYDHPFQWGSKRNGPDLARVGNKYSDKWHVEHMINPRAVVPDSIMPGYPFLAKTELDTRHLADVVKTNALVGVPYTEDQIANVAVDVAAQKNPDDKNVDAFLKRYPKSVARDFSGQPGKLTELDAVVAYLQVLGTLVDFSLYDDKANLR
ncbi:cytochrome-c oxidase, cbb3-type subunit II [Siculibacillus lacustris]|uniref:Cytochrome-c oxidase, cbb3-type subunit II n=1 Tax=Siculibacillus lacustris TaxID=1549641 RepID=A0A4Q9VQD4_9HYPH|nr:cytochrome-c oxidase, cbb3-type subunit II [Siculibacillus lacustris]TBW37177.1 cytochrome-c oxidase, cbb3-type subunit II [Siculibacillus lacustris]